MKKVFTLLALLACFLGANAKEVVDKEVNFADFTDISQVPFASWRGSESAFARLSVQNGCLHFESSEATDPTWDCQFFPIGGVNAEVGVVYTLHYKIKGDHAGNVSMLGFGQTPYGQFSITTDWVEGTVDYEATNNDGNILMQCGDWIGSWDIAYLKITHEERDNQRPKEWIPMLENGDAETPWADPSIRFDDPENNYKVSAWGKVYGQDNSDPVPAKIEVEEGNPSNHVFVVHSTEKLENDWDNQFWIMAPRELKTSEPIKVSFRYKASTNIDAVTQVHGYPSQYLNNGSIGTISFTTEWKTYEGEISWTGGQSIVWNLNSSGNGAPVDFYFDDLSISELKVDHGWFVASSSAANGIAYDYDNAIEFEEFGEGILTATVGTKGKPATWVNELMISTVRGHDGSFKSNTIAPTSTNIVPFDLETEQGQIYDFTEKSGAKIALPAAGVWQILLFPNNKNIAFVQIEGDAVVVKEPVDIITNKEVLVIEGVERDDLSDGTNQDGTPNVREEEGGTGETWDNQFFIVANRVLQPNEETVLEFDYVATTEAGTTTGTHASPGDYRKNAIPDFTFTTEEQHLKVDYTVPAADWSNNPITDAQSIAFDLAMIKGACTYTINNVKWYLKDENNEGGKTMENLVKETGTDNFYIKIGAGTSPYTPSGISSVVNEKKTSTVTYNLAGQRVTKGYKGIVIKNGAKYIAK